MKPLKNPNIQGALMLILVIIIAGIYVYTNRQTQQTIAYPQPPATETPQELAEWQVNLQENLAALPSPTYTDQPSATAFIPPTSSEPTATIQTFQVQIQPSTNTPVFLGSPTPLPPELVTPSPSFIQNNTVVPLPTGIDIVSAPNFEEEAEKFQLPPEEVPLSAHPFDHFFLTRPIDVTANSEYLFWYPYGSSGAGWRIHRGLDIPNAIGEEVRAAGNGTVVWADRAYQTEYDGDLEVYASYGNVVVIEHDFSWRGQKIWTLYAHLSAIAVERGQVLETGDVIGLVGITGNVTGPHVHFEVRVGIDSYSSTRNPMLWMAPYIGHGVVAGRVVDADGNYIDKAIVQLNANGRITDRTTTYEDPYNEGDRYWTVVPDSNWKENFALGDIPEGDYQLVIVYEDERIFENIRVNPGTVTFVEVAIGDITQAATLEGQFTPTALPTGIITEIPPTALPSATP